MQQQYKIPIVQNLIPEKQNKIIIQTNQKEGKQPEMQNKQLNKQQQHTHTVENLRDDLYFFLQIILSSYSFESTLYPLPSHLLSSFSVILHQQKDSCSIHHFGQEETHFDRGFPFFSFHLASCESLRAWVYHSAVNQNAPKLR